MCCSICSAIIFIVVELLVLASTIAAQPVGFFKPKTKVYSILCDELTISFCEAEAKWCYTLWGYKDNCKQSKLTLKGLDAWGCKNRKVKMEVAEAFSIISIVLAAFIIVMGFLMMCKCMKSVLIMLILCAVASVCLVISWGSALNIFTSDNCGAKLKDNTKLGLGFIFLIIATVLQICNTLKALFLLLCSCGRADGF